MSMSFGLATTLSTSQKLTPQMQQAIKLLQLSSLELAQEVQAKLDSNPLLERIEDDEEYGDSEGSDSGANDSMETAEHSLTLDDWNQTTATDAFSSTAKKTDEYGADSGVDIDRLETVGLETNGAPAGDDNITDFDAAAYNDDDNVTDYRTDNYASAASSQTTSSAQHANEDFDSYQGGTSATIQDHVRWQLNFKRLSDTDTLIAEYLIDSMDEMGFVRLDIDELLQSLDTMASFYQWEERVERDEILAVLRIVQSCDPLGVGARDLSECLALQLAKLDPSTAYLKEAHALLSASEYLVSNNIKALTEHTGLTSEDIMPALTLLRTLTPLPGVVFQKNQPDHAQSPDSYDIPDVLVTPIRRPTGLPDAQEAGWQVRLNPETLPKLRVNQEYASLVKRGDDSPDNQYLRDNLTDARLFIRSIEERNQNLLKVATSIVHHQQAFLQQGATAMQPLVLKVIADEVGLHESTVSRLTTSKTILTPQGLFSLKHFFSSHVSSADGDISSTAISAMIKQLIADEDPKKPLSDSRIKETLLADGIDIARRTVAKYREAMNIGSSTQRKQKY
ncbi:RNA polymerase factor sigma-54 [Psychrobacter sp. Rd 27.2]|uniref:RNA polymerase factor sigma-54 n=1 Tax=Psychrobacter sp. Rd 27.2 TaxID=1926479 RepID=UPI0009470F1D|nr:RNA polymerase factor sigma-54 [Psychrobacter sp. Rd 27.2]OLF40662.1 RNA polymerase sigma-54 factor [Psychrobacter sp. Rd 27.2]